MRPNLSARIVAEFLGTAFLVAAVVGSGIMAERLSGGNAALALLANTLATGAALVALILTFGPISGAHLNPVVSVADALEGGLSAMETVVYVLAQTSGGLAGTLAAHAMFGLPLFSLSHHARSGSAQLFSEFVATFGLLCDLGMLPFPLERCPVRSRSLHYRRVLVYILHIVRQSCGDDCAVAQ